MEGRTGTADAAVWDRNSSSSSVATGTAEAANTVACMEKDGWKFFLLEWEDKITESLLTELKHLA